MAEADPCHDSLAAKRPLSPHVSVYKPMLTMMMSFAHRITGAGLYLGVIMFALFFAGLALGPDAFALVAWITNSLIGRVIVFLLSWALLHHLLGGVRHALWDRGLYMDPEGRELAARATLGGGLALTLLLWIGSTLAG
ncbi:MAG: succinate dehydrogenase, cytochrome b556 subunit [Methylocystis sp.]|nr:succinate dehydrogenase, cytochrome b556 subunit [Methylocystis sp.]MBI3274987.1 succinate dehydrogenase, cytochrome b556 subunit [Methylocystis sp.]